jgi:hypothetical protein
VPFCRLLAREGGRATKIPFISGTPICSPSPGTSRERRPLGMLAYKHVRTRRCRHPCSAADQSRHWSALSMGGANAPLGPSPGLVMFSIKRVAKISATSTGSAQQALRNAQTSYPGGDLPAARGPFCRLLAREGGRPPKIPSSPASRSDLRAPGQAGKRSRAGMFWSVSRPAGGSGRHLGHDQSRLSEQRRPDRGGARAFGALSGC